MEQAMTKFERPWAKEGFVSVWVGHFPSEADFDAYLAEQYGDDEKPLSAFAAESDLGWYDHDYREAYFVEGGIPEAIHPMIGGFSYGASFVDAVVAAAAKRGLREANAAVLLFDCKYHKDTDTNKRLTWLGSFAYDKTASPV
jgi:hypothetical protein